jgi:hypothetical protein
MGELRRRRVEVSFAERALARRWVIDTEKEENRGIWGKPSRRVRRCGPQAVARLSGSREMAPRDGVGAAGQKVVSVGSWRR